MHPERRITAKALTLTNLEVEDDDAVASQEGDLLKSLKTALGGASLLLVPLINHITGGYHFQGRALESAHDVRAQIVRNIRRESGTDPQGGRVSEYRLLRRAVVCRIDLLRPSHEFGAVGRGVAQLQPF